MAGDPVGLLDPDDIDPDLRQIVSEPDQIADLCTAASTVPQNERCPGSLGRGANHARWSVPGVDQARVRRRRTARSLLADL